MTEHPHNYYTFEECIDAVMTVSEETTMRNISADVYDRCRHDPHPCADVIAARLGGGSFAVARQRVKEDREFWPCPECGTVSRTLRAEGRCPFC